MLKQRVYATQDPRVTLGTDETQKHDVAGVTGPDKDKVERDDEQSDDEDDQEEEDKAADNEPDTADCCTVVVGCEPQYAQVSSSATGDKAPEADGKVRNCDDAHWNMQGTE